MITREFKSLRTGAHTPKRGIDAEVTKLFLKFFCANGKEWLTFRLVCSGWNRAGLLQAPVRLQLDFRHRASVFRHVARNMSTLEEVHIVEQDFAKETIAGVEALRSTCSRLRKLKVVDFYPNQALLDALAKQASLTHLEYKSRFAYAEDELRPVVLDFSRFPNLQTLVLHDPNPEGTVLAPTLKSLGLCNTAAGSRFVLERNRPMFSQIPNTLRHVEIALAWYANVGALTTLLARTFLECDGWNAADLKKSCSSVIERRTTQSTIRTHARPLEEY